MAIKCKKGTDVAVGCLLMFASVQFAGCGGYSTKQLSLTYPPEPGASELSSPGMIDDVGSSNQYAVILEIFDARTETNRVGGQFRTLGNR